MARSNNTGNGEFQTAAQKKKLLADYIEHCKQGLTDGCFPPCDIQTFNEIATLNPDIFPVRAIERARRERQLFWEKIGITGALGKIRGFNAASWKEGVRGQFSDDSDVPIFSKLV